MSLTKGESLPLARTLLRAAPSGGDTPQRPECQSVCLAAFTLAQQNVTQIPPRQPEVLDLSARAP